MSTRAPATLPEGEEAVRPPWLLSLSRGGRGPNSVEKCRKLLWNRIGRKVLDQTPCAGQ
jgi:hypothetical protein